MAPWLEKMDPKGLLTDGVDTVDELVAVPTHAHHPITREQREFWDTIGEELRVKKGKRNYRPYEEVVKELEATDTKTQKKYFRQYKAFVATQKAVPGHCTSIQWLA